MKPVEVGDRITIRTVASAVDGSSVRPATGWHSKDLIVRNDGPNMRPSPPEPMFEGWQCQTCGAQVGYVGRFLQLIRLSLHRHHI